MYSAQFIGGPFSGKRRTMETLNEFFYVRTMPPLKFNDPKAQFAESRVVVYVLISRWGNHGVYMIEPKHDSTKQA